MDKKTALIDSQILNTIAFGCFALYHFNQETTALYVGAFMAALALIWITIALFHLKEIKLGTEGYGNVFVVSIFCNLIFSIFYLIIFVPVPLDRQRGHFALSLSQTETQKPDRY